MTRQELEQRAGDIDVARYAELFVAHSDDGMHSIAYGLDPIGDEFFFEIVVRKSTGGLVAYNHSRELDPMAEDEFLHDFIRPRPQSQRP